MLLIKYEHYEHFNYKFTKLQLLRLLVISYELWTVPYNDTTRTLNS